MLGLQDTTMSACVKLGEGNPGALRVCAQILKENPKDGILDLLHMDDMGMKGPAIWIGFKDYAGQDLTKFIQAIRSRSQEMVSVIRANGYDVSTEGRS